MKKEPLGYFIAFVLICFILTGCGGGGGGGSNNSTPTQNQTNTVPPPPVSQPDPAPVVTPPIAPEQTPPTNNPVIAQYNIAFVGDSRLADNVQGTYTWAGLLGREDVVSLAIPGEKATDWVEDKLNRIAKLKATGAKRVIIQYGKNDIDAGKSAQQIAALIAQIVQEIKANIPGVRVFVVGVLPVASTAHNAAYTNTVIDQTNTAIYAAVGKSVWYQGYAGMKDVSNGTLYSMYTDDGTHLNYAGRLNYAMNTLLYLINLQAEL